MDIQVVIDDPRMRRILGEHDQPCALQFWIFQHEKEGRIFSKIIYGRILPYNYANSTWVTQNQHFKVISEEKIRLSQLFLYTQSTTIRKILSEAAKGENLRDISSKLLVDWKSSSIENQFGDCRLSTPYTWISSAYLPMGDDFYNQGLNSVYNGFGVFRLLFASLKKSNY